MLKEKSEIVAHQHHFIRFIEGLENFNEHVLLTPIRDGKWSTIEIIGHFYTWDEFVLQNRIPYLLTNSSLPSNPNADDLNLYSAYLARNEPIQHTFEKSIRIRKKLIETLSDLPEENWFAELTINYSSLSLYSYFKGLMEHDIHHMRQILTFLKDTQNIKKTETLVSTFPS